MCCLPPRRLHSKVIKEECLEIDELMMIDTSPKNQHVGFDHFSSGWHKHYSTLLLGLCFICILITNYVKGKDYEGMHTQESYSWDRSPLD